MHGHGKLQSSITARTAMSRIAFGFASLLLAAGCSHAPAPAPSASTPRTLLLGEVHDNAQGQRLRVAELRRRLATGWRPVIVMEQFDRENQALLTRAARECADPDCIIRVMEQPRWDWSLYRPVLDLAISYQLPLVAAGLSPAPRADKRTLLRRVSINLTGLPPTYDEYIAFEADPDPDAYRKAVERLLATPRDIRDEATEDHLHAVPGFAKHT